MLKVNKYKIFIPAFIFLSLCLIFAMMPATPAISADIPALQKAPLNPAFQQYQQQITQAKTLKAKTALSENYGYIPPTVNLSHIDSIPLAQASSQPKAQLATALPSSFDWRSNPTNYVTSVKDQNPCGTCWAFGNTAVMESKVWIDGLGSNKNYSEQALACCIDPSFVFLIGNRCMAGGNDFISQDTLIKKGSKLETCQPYSTGSIDTQACLNCTPAFKTTNFVWAAWSDTTSETRTAIKNAIVNNGPVTVTFYYSSPYLEAGNIYYYPGDNDQNHLVTIVGWDDTIPHPEGGGSGAWLAKNSWGDTWGNSGYFWLCYGKANATTFGSLQGVMPNSGTEKLYYWDESGWVGDYGFTSGDSTKAVIANIFSASKAGKLTNVDFYTGGVNTQYNIKIYKSGNINSLGTVAATQTGACGSAGYYSIQLTNPVSLTKSQAFTVVVYITTPGYNYPIPAEWVIDGFCEPPIQTGKSFYKHLMTDTSWIDASVKETELDTPFNICLRARVNSIPGIVNALPSIPGTDISFVWYKLSGATKYYLQVNTKSDFTGTSIFDSELGNVNNQTVPGFLSDGKIYCWRIKGGNSAGWGAWSAVQKFKNSPAPP